MIRRRRRLREIPFSFDSFLDIVANVVGVIIRLILVVWVGARSYSSVQSVINTATPIRETAIEAQEISDPLQQELAQHQRELARAQQQLLEELRALEQFQRQDSRSQADWSALAVRRRNLGEKQAELARRQTADARASQLASLTSAELRQRSQKLAEEIRAVQQLPPLKKTLRYRTPVSHPVTSEELLFECSRGRVTFIDIAALLGDVRQGIEEKGKLLQSQWQVDGSAGPVGAFRLRYTLERERGLFDALAGAANPETNGSFRYGLSGWYLEAIASVRGETALQALAEESEFRQIVDTLDPRQTAVTFWVYPDSFELFRQLRDYLYERDIVVAGRPLPEGIPIASSRRGSVSRGQ